MTDTEPDEYTLTEFQAWALFALISIWASLCAGLIAGVVYAKNF